MTRCELLAPAGDIEAGYAAFYYGADAVYLGLNRFSARAEATNFTPAELNALCGFARTANKKVLVAVNTVIFDSELPALIETLSDVSDRLYYTSKDVIERNKPRFEAFFRRSDGIKFFSRQGVG